MKPTDSLRELADAAVVIRNCASREGADMALSLFVLKAASLLGCSEEEAKAQLDSMRTPRLRVVRDEPTEEDWAEVARWDAEAAEEEAMHRESAEQENAEFRLDGPVSWRNRGVL